MQITIVEILCNKKIYMCIYMSPKCSNQKNTCTFHVLVFYIFFNSVL